MTRRSCIILVLVGLVIVASIGLNVHGMKIGFLWEELRITLRFLLTIMFVAPALQLAILAIGYTREPEGTTRDTKVQDVTNFRNEWRQVFRQYLRFAVLTAMFYPLTYLLSMIDIPSSILSLVLFIATWLIFSVFAYYMYRTWNLVFRATPIHAKMSI